MGRKISTITLTDEDRTYLETQTRARNAEITDDEKAWIINIACQKPTDFGYAAETGGTYSKAPSMIGC